jgi:hypothetical protein
MSEVVLVRQVILAKWLKITGLYAVTFNCGHEIECSEAMLSGQMVCLECFRDMLRIKAG